MGEPFSTVMSPILKFMKQRLMDEEVWLFVGDMVSLCSLGWFGTQADSYVSAFQVLGLQMCSSMPGLAFS